MSTLPPEGSHWMMETVDGRQQILMPYPPAGIGRFFVALFLLFWLAGWFSGLTDALNKLMAGETTLFLAAWLGAWILGGVFACGVIFRILQKSVPQQLLVDPSLLTLDTGVPPFRLPSGQQMPRDQFKLLFPKRRRVEFSPSDLRTMTLRQTETGNRLTIDKGAERIEVATGASEIEREWLFDVLRNAYGMQQA